MAVGWSSASGIMLLAGFAVLAFILLRISDRKAVYDD